MTLARELKRRGITYPAIVARVRELFPHRTCSIWMVSHVLCGRSRSRYVTAAIDSLLAPAPAASPAPVAAPEVTAA